MSNVTSWNSGIEIDDSLFDQKDCLFGTSANNWEEYELRTLCNTLRSDSVQRSLSFLCEEFAMKKLHGETLTPWELRVEQVAKLGLGKPLSKEDLELTNIVHSVEYVADYYQTLIALINRNIFVNADIHPGEYLTSDKSLRGVEMLDKRNAQAKTLDSGPGSNKAVICHDDEHNLFEIPVKNQRFSEMFMALLEQNKICLKAVYTPRTIYSENFTYFSLNAVIDWSII